jgi:PAS domain S-box-containing protein
VKRLTKAELRSRAEERLKRSGPRPHAGKTEAEQARLAHELEVHQIELEMQNEELRQAHADVESLLGQYTDLYDFAPVGYVTIDREGAIRLANLKTSRMLGVERSRLQGRRLRDFVVAPSRRAFDDFLSRAFASHVPEDCEVALERGGQESFLGRIEFLASEDGQTGRVILFDLTERRRAEEQARTAEAEKLALSERSRRALLSAAEDQRAATAALAASEAALRESAIRMQSILEATSESIWLFSTDGRILDANGTAAARFGLKPADVVGKRFEEILSPELSRSRSARIREVADSGQPVEFEDERAGIVFRHNFYPVRDRSGRVTAVVSYSRDITERKLAEEALRDRERLLQDVIDGSPSPIFLKDSDGKFITINTSLERMLGLSREDIKGKTDYDIATKEVADYWRAHDKQVMATGKAIQIEEMADLQDGHHVFLANKFPLVDTDGRTYGVGAISHDITERKLAEARLREQSLMLANANDAIIGYSLDYRVTFWNRSAELMYGYSEADALGKVSAELLRPVYVGASREDVIARLDADGHVETESIRTTRDGRQLSVEAHVIALRDEQGRVTGYVSVDRDITERKASEARIARLAKLYAMLSRVNETIVRTRDRRTLFAEVCRIVSEEGGFPLVWIGLVEGTRVVPAVCCGKASEYLREISVEVDGELGKGPTGTAIREDRAVVNEDSGANPAMAAWREPALRYGLRASASFPLRRNGKVVGAFTLYAAEPGSFDTEQVGLLEALSADLSYAVEALEQEERRTAAEEALRVSEQRFRSLYSSMSEGLALHELIYDEDGRPSDYRIVGVNPAFEAITGLPVRQAVGAMASQLYGTGSAPFLDIYSGVVESGSPVSFEVEWPPMAKSFHISVFAFAKGRFATVFTDITARKQAEAELRRSNSFNQSIIDSSSDCIKILDMEGRLTYLSPAGQRLLGIKDLAAYLNLPYEEFWKGSDRKGATDAIEKARQGRNGSFRGFCPTVDGVPKWWDVSISPIMGADGKPERLLAVSRDVTERRSSEEALREAKETLEVRVKERTAELVAEVEERKRAEEHLATASQHARSLIEASLDPLVTINSEGRITDVNEAIIRATGASRVELIGTDFSEYFTQPEKAREGYRRVFAEGSVTDYPLTIRHRNGHLTDVLYNASVYRDAKGEVRGVFAAARDVTDRKLAEEALAAERQRMADVLNMLPAYVVLLAPDYTVPFANRFFEERFGKSEGRFCYDYLFHRTEPCEDCESFKVLKTGGQHHWEWLGPDGRNYDINDFPFKDADGSPLIMEVGIDITERKRAEQELQKAHDTLEVKVAERTAELQRSNAELEQFAYVASHDLQEPLRMVASYVELLGQRYRGRLDEKADKYIAYASGGAKRMHELVNDLLAFSRVGTRTAPMSEVNLERVVARARENLAVAIEQSGATVTVDPMPVVTGDESQLTQLFQNLIDNAIKFHGAEPPRIRINAERIEEVPAPSPDPAVPRSLDPFVTIRVADNGIGIDPRHAERIFGLFKRLHTSDEYPGTGIGLAVCKKIVERHGGTIRVEPAEGGGSVFLFTLPGQAQDSGYPPRPPAREEKDEPAT